MGGGGKTRDGRGWWARLLGRPSVPGRIPEGDAGDAPQGRAPDSRDPAGRVQQPYVSRTWRYTSLQFTGAVTQSRMRTFQPGHLLVDYTRTMMGSLLFRPAPSRIGMIGLGGGSQVKFIHRHLPKTRLEVVENNAAVIALRRRFRIPDNDARLQVIHGDGAHFVRDNPGRYDILLVDAYDVTGIPQALSSQQYYDDCRAALAPDGVMASNLFCADADRHIERMRRSFGKRRVLVVEEARMSNRVAFAWVGDPLPGDAFEVAAQLARVAPGARRSLAPVLEEVARALRAQRLTQTPA
ncbi:spermine/spermidine synthase domain-containing protein [Luteimonas sp. RIT-PG2_3]|jgi:spermidine synthase